MYAKQPTILFDTSKAVVSEPICSSETDTEEFLAKHPTARIWDYEFLSPDLANSIVSYSHQFTYEPPAIDVLDECGKVDTFFSSDSMEGAEYVYKSSYKDIINNVSFWMSTDTYLVCLNEHNRPNHEYYLPTSGDLTHYYLTTNQVIPGSRSFTKKEDYPYSAYFKHYTNRNTQPIHQCVTKLIEHHALMVELIFLQNLRSDLRLTTDIMDARDSGLVRCISPVKDNSFIGSMLVSDLNLMRYYLATSGEPIIVQQADHCFAAPEGPSCKEHVEHKQPVIGVVPEFIHNENRVNTIFTYIDSCMQERQIPAHLDLLLEEVKQLAYRASEL